MSSNLGKKTVKCQNMEFHKVSVKLKRNKGVDMSSNLGKKTVKCQNMEFHKVSVKLKRNKVF